MPSTLLNELLAAGSLSQPAVDRILAATGNNLISELDPIPGPLVDGDLLAAQVQSNLADTFNASLLDVRSYIDAIPNTLTDDGQLLSFDGVQYFKLAVGADGQILTSRPGAAVQSKLAWEDPPATGLPEAPVDGQSYARRGQDTSWQPSYNKTEADAAFPSQASFDSHVGDATIHFTEGSIDHANIQNIGTNSHTQIDSHIADQNNPHSTKVGNLDDVTLTDPIANNLLQFTGTQWVDRSLSQAGIEPSLGNPTIDGYLLSSTAAGVRSWVPPSAGGGGIGKGTPFTVGDLLAVESDAGDGTAQSVGFAASDVARLSQPNTFTGSPNRFDGIVQVFGGTSGAPGLGAARLRLEDDEDIGIQFQTPATAKGIVAFGRPSSTMAGRLQFDHATNEMKLDYDSSRIQFRPGGIVVSDAGSGFLGDGIINAKGLAIDGSSVALQSSLDTHIADNTNPHSVTAAQTGAEPDLGNPSTDGFVLSSTAAGVRSWVARGQPSGPDTAIQLNAAGSFGGTANYTTDFSASDTSIVKIRTTDGDGEWEWLQASNLNEGVRNDTLGSYYNRSGSQSDKPSFAFVLEPRFLSSGGAVDLCEFQFRYTPPGGGPAQRPWQGNIDNLTGKIAFVHSNVSNFDITDDINDVNRILRINRQDMVFASQDNTSNTLFRFSAVAGTNTQNAFIDLASSGFNGLTISSHNIEPATSGNERNSPSLLLQGSVWTGEAPSAVNAAEFFGKVNSLGDYAFVAKAAGGLNLEWTSGNELIVPGKVAIAEATNDGNLTLKHQSIAPAYTENAVNLVGTSTVILRMGTDPGNNFGAYLQTNANIFPLLLNPVSQGASGGGVGIGTATPGAHALKVNNGNISFDNESFLYRFATDDMILGSATGGGQGAGTINCKGVFKDGVEITGGGGSPGGASGSVQFNDSSSFGGFGSWNGSKLLVAINSTGFDNAPTGSIIVVEDTTDPAFAIQSAQLGKGYFYFADNNVNDPGWLMFDHSTNQMQIKAGGGFFNFGDTGVVFFNATGGAQGAGTVNTTVGYYVQGTPVLTQDVSNHTVIESATDVVIVKNLPTSDPGIEDALWSDAGVIKSSAGV